MSDGKLVFPQGQNPEIRLTLWQRGYARLAPPETIRRQALEDILSAFRTRQLHLLSRASSRVMQNLAWRAKLWWWQTRLRLTPPQPSGMIQVAEVQPRPAVQPHQATTDLIICVHNALPEVQQCLASVLQHTSPPYSLILVDDGSDLPTRDYLAEFARRHGATLLRNEEARGYTKAANQGLRQSSAEFAILLNSDTIVAPGWLDRLIACAESDPRIGLVGPLSNTATWQSIPKVLAQGDWAANPLPPDLSLEQMGQLVATYSARLYPSLPFLNGFCLLLRQQVLQEIGYFDEEHFGVGYGEENDYCLRARQANWLLALADDTYVYHAQSKSYSTERRKRLSEQAHKTLLRKHGEKIVQEGVAFCQHDRVMEGIRAHSQMAIEQRGWIEQGRALFAGRRVLFLLPVMSSHGGGSVVLFKAQLMRSMGVEAEIFNLTDYRAGFERSYPGFSVPVVYGEIEDIPAVAAQYDAVVATANITVEWLAPTFRQQPHLIRGYFIQDFEPYFYPTGSDAFKVAWASYDLIPDLVRFTTTRWIQQEVMTKIGVDCGLVGPSFNANLFRPRPRSGLEWPHRPLRIAAMIRPEADYRAPRLTMEILQQMTKKFGSLVEIRLFGTELGPENVYFAKLPYHFPWQLAGRLNQKQMANFLNEVDIFVDFSTHQALGITAQEAMACGVAVVVPSKGGTNAIARDGENCLVVDTSSAKACEQALCRLIEDHTLRAHLQRNGIFDACAFYPEKPAFNMLAALFGRNDMHQNIFTNVVRVIEQA